MIGDKVISDVEGNDVVLDKEESEAAAVTIVVVGEVISNVEGNSVFVDAVANPKGDKDE